MIGWKETLDDELASAVVPTVTRESNPRVYVVGPRRNHRRSAIARACYNLYLLIARSINRRYIESENQNPLYAIWYL